MPDHHEQILNRLIEMQCMVETGTVALLPDQHLETGNWVWRVVTLEYGKSRADSVIAEASSPWEAIAAAHQKLIIQGEKAHGA